MLTSRPKTKIVCTLGPSTESEETIRALVENGMSVARLNLSHGTLDKHREAVEIVREVSKNIGIPVGIMVDVPGAKYRVGPINTSVLHLQNGQNLTLTSRDVVGSQELVSVSPPGIHKDARVGHPVLIDDGMMELDVLEVQDKDVLCRVSRGGRLTERRGVATPGKTPSYSFPDEQSMVGLEFAANQRADFVALSMVSNDADIEKAKDILSKHGLEPFIISKIERMEALHNFDKILQATDSVMVARGDMGVQTRLAQVPMIQKDLITKCNANGKPVITATQMLESMINSPVPTRAEVTDVANAVFDGTDAIMLSGETSVGQHPVEAVKMMAEVATETEAALPYEKIIIDKRQQLEPYADDAISYNACQTAHQLDAALIVAFTETGTTAGRVSKYRPKSPILALTPKPEVQRRLTLRWGITPILQPNIDTVDDFFAKGEEHAVEVAALEAGSPIILVAGLPIGVSGGTNLLRVMVTK